MNCNHVQQQLDDFLDEQLSAIEQETVIQHLFDCETCSALFADSQHLLLQLRNMPAPEPDKGYQDRVFSFLKERESPTAQHFPHWFAAGFATAVVAVLSVWLLFTPGSTQQDLNKSIVTIKLAPQQVRKVNLVFNSPAHIKQARLRLDLPDNIELSGYANRHTLEWNTDLKIGTNHLTLPLIAKGSSDGRLKASIFYGGKTRTFQIQIEAAPASTQRNVTLPLTT